jgi:hypothetical protein
MTTTDDNIFAGIDFDEGSDNPFGIEPGTHEVVISAVSIERSEKGNLGLWITFSDESGKTIRKWTTMPEKSQDDVARKRNTSFLRMLLNQLELPEEKWKKLLPNDMIGMECVIIVKPQTNNPEYTQVSKITRDRKHGSDMGIGEFDSPTGPESTSGAGYKF